MNSWINISLSIFLFIFYTAAYGCSFKSDTQKVYSLSGPATVLLNELELLRSEQLAAVSTFHPVNKAEFKGEFLPGGIFISRGVMQKFRHGLVVFDESRELSKNFNQIKDFTSLEIKTRGLSPIEVTSSVLETLSPYLKNCEKKMSALKVKAEKLSEEIIALVPKDFKAVFFLGELKKKRPPEMAMVNDGIVKWLVEKKKLKTYPTELAYVNWSAKLMSEMSADTIMIGVKDSGQKMDKKVTKVSDKEWNLTYPGSLIPGMSQLEAWYYLLKKINVDF